VIELDRWNSPYETRRIVRLRYYNSGREVEYSYKELAITGAMKTSIVESTDKKSTSHRDGRKMGTGIGCW
jgi:hypothetical protein